MKNAVCLIVILGSLSFAAVAAELYKWVDENGVIHYSQMPPENALTEEVEVQEQYPDAEPPPGESIYGEVIEQQKTRRDLEQQREAAEKLKRETHDAEKSRGSQNCSQAIHYLQTLQKQCPVFYDGVGILRAACLRPGYYSYEGERTYVEDDERQKMIVFYSGIVEKCKNQ